jgi:DNA-binding transcriptional regulator/RsmH inhibitor MraZ
LNSASGGQNLESHLAKPWQRVMKYSLLLKEILKRVTIESERALVQNTIRQLERTVEDLNRRQEDVDRLRIGQEKERQYGLTMCGPARSYVFDSQVKVITHNSKLVQTAVLCTDVLFLGKKRGMFSAATFVEYDLREVLVIRYPSGTSKFFIMRLAATQG